MKILILGGVGMAGHMLRRYFASKPGCEVLYTIRQPADEALAPASSSERFLVLNALNLGDADRLLEEVRPDIVINAVGILNQHAEAMPRHAEIVNGWFPHWIAGKLDELGDGGKLVHISTDCVFAGTVDEADEVNGVNKADGADRKVRVIEGDRRRDTDDSDDRGINGRYRETDMPDGTSVYARTKAAGEVKDSRHLTIRTSIIGPEIRSQGIGLFGWFMKQHGIVHGYTRVLWNGVTTLQLAKSIDDMLHRGVSGLYHLTAPSCISKHDLLGLIAEQFDKRDVRLIPADMPILDRTLACTRTDYRAEVPDYPKMLSELREWMGSS
ncbi:NAD(P)-dependent oxidoreductase [Insulibacter thermoxylanivorax]|uniref:dTDP-4-dehydrorhamnose reductase n=1 Tax=Insulibacter thermoxylanivorax TaxID=2749268 RepID=A0A916VEU9_9BACL|nr:sugar nucleotide-binding protein [Insulibacter thermoxylanivorax]GFR36994.1 NAD(P)-dependent oxidoreductase [Insulibacter thermoxylanivorax]